MPQLAVPGPLAEADLSHQLRLDPVDALASQSFRFGQRRRRTRQGRELRRQPLELTLVEAGSDLPGESELAVREIADEERADPGAAPLRIGPPDDDELLLHRALELEPFPRAAA